MNQEVYHIPALLQPTIDVLAIDPAGIYVDATYGGGGHSKEILSHLTTGHLYSFDQDIDAVERAVSDPRFTMIYGNFRYLRNFLRYYGVELGAVSGILADLGVSFHHFDDADRGFSFRWEGALDMRMNRAGGRTAAQVLAESTEERIADILYLYGELKNGRRIAAEISRRNNTRPITTVQDLLEVVKPLVNPRQEKKELAQIFQALRIEVNDELASLKALLTQALEMLRPGGRLAVITYHSLEDRLVKNFMKTGNFEGKAEKDFFGKTLCDIRTVNSKPITPTDEEIAENPRSRSAKLRIAEKI